MKGTADIDALINDPTSKRLFEIFKTSKSELKITITESKMMNRCKNWNKCTEISPSGRHLGHYHALFRPFKCDNKTKKVSIKEKREAIIQVHFMMLQIAEINSHVYAELKNILMCMIEKNQRFSKIHYLQVVHLYECDLNLLLGLYMREMDQYCKKNCLLNEGFYGGRPGRRSIDPIIVDLLKMK